MASRELQNVSATVEFHRAVKELAELSGRKVYAVCESLLPHIEAEIKKLSNKRKVITNVRRKHQ